MRDDSDCLLLQATIIINAVDVVMKAGNSDVLQALPSAPSSSLRLRAPERQRLILHD